MLQTAAPLAPTLASPAILQSIEDETFEDQTIAIDGTEYRNCTFIRCRIIFTGLDLSVFTRCKFVTCDWVFSGPAANTVNYLGALYGGLGEHGQEMIEGIFESIRRGDVKSDGLLSSSTAPK